MKVPRVTWRGKWAVPALGLVAGVAASAGGCGYRTEWPTEGTLAIAIEESIAPVIYAEVDEFHRLYPKATITSTVASTREAVLQMLQGRVKCAFVSRWMDQEESRAAAEYKIQVDSLGFAYDGVVLLVHGSNPVTGLRLDQIGAIYRREIRNWAEVGGSDLPVVPLALSRNTAAATLLLREAVRDTVFAEGVFGCETSPAMIEAVAGRPGAIGFVGLAWLGDELPGGKEDRDRVKTLDVAAGEGARYEPPIQSAIYRGRYPLRRRLYVLNADRRIGGLSSGFIAFVASAPGQSLVLKGGLVPATMPVKLVKLQ